MKLPHLSIQHSLLISLATLLALVAMSSLVSWIAFERVSKNQQLLLRESLPTMYFVENAVSTGGDLVRLGNTLSRPVSQQELELLKAQAVDLLDKVQADLEEFNQRSAVGKGVNVLNEGTKDLVETIQQQLVLQQKVLLNKLFLQQERSLLLSAVEGLLIDIKLILAEISLKLIEADIQSKESIRHQLATLTELRFDAQRIESLIDESVEVSSFAQVEGKENLYRLQIKKLGVRFIEFEESHRQKLVNNMVLLHDNFLKDDNFFQLLSHRVTLLSALTVAQEKNLTLGKILSKTYKSFSQRANNELDTEAQKILQVVVASQFILMVSGVISLLVVLLLAFLFIKPKIINRIHRLTNDTRAIANNQYEVDIDISGNDEISAMASSLAYFRDQLVEKQHVQQALIDREKTLSTIIDNVTEGLFTVDINGDIKNFNPAFESIFGVSSGQVIQRRINDFLPSEEVLFLTHNDCSQSFDSTEGSVLCQAKPVIATKVSGDTFFGELSVSLIHLSGVLVYSCFIRDVTIEYEARSRMDKLVDELSKSNADLERFAYSCSHDLQEPIRIISAFTQLLREHIVESKSTDETIERYLGFLERSAHDAEALVKSILEYSRLDQTTIEKVWVDSVELYQRVHSTLMVLLSEKNGRLIWNDDGVRLYVVEAQMFQLIMNLVVNGLKYNNDEVPTVSLSAIEEDHYWEICVEDNGIGINPRYHEQIFNLFNRLMSKREYTGSGIGLALCKKIAEKHGGAIRIESQEGQGSRFYVRLPKLVNE
ncbi:hypothetical protein AB835_04150 [Candidatus Endobugula sertula]|uniref:histidine kinase n=1 Tax=Candidatus Endobugula sertula TaxID=62101 RepID=A0A1D2QS48_9GAMM|nr:hypothetical protein AB835_04150 [Candidatus Endobugula sertula]